MPREGYKECPFCAEEILEKAIKCRYCHSMLVEVPGAIAGKPPEVPSTEEERRLERVIKYLPPKVAEIIQKDVEITDEGERRKITVLFADLSGFTSLSEEMDPERTKLLMDDCFHVMVGCIDRYNGTIDKYMGDAVMALFGAPQAHEDDPELAIRAADAMRRAIRELGHRRNLRLELAFGVSSGEVVVGGLGDRQHLEYTAIGDCVNLAYRLEHLAEPGEILVDENTYRLISDVFECDSFGPVVIRGQKHPVKTYRVGKITPETTHGARLRRKDLTPFVGREIQLTRLKSWVENSFVREGTFVRLVGNAGVGKSRLLLELRRRLNPLRKSWLVAPTVSFGRSIPYHPLVSCLKELCDISPEDGDSEIREKSQRAVSEDTEEPETTREVVAHLLGLQPKAESHLLEYPPKERRDLIFQHLLRIFRGIAEKQTLVLVFDDLQWADDATLEFLNYVLPRFRETPITVLLVYRPHFTHRWPDSVQFHDLELVELSRLQSELLLDRILSIPSLDPDVRRRILEKAGGNPFYVEEILRAMRDRGVLKPKGDTYEVVGDLEAVPIPDTLHGLILSRIDLLEIQVKRVLQCAAVIGHRFTYSILEYLTEIKEGLRNYLSELAGVELIYEESSLPELEYLFRHVLVQEVAYRTLLERRRRDYHGRIALCLEELCADRLHEHYELLAHHFHHSDYPDKAIDYCWKAGEKSRLLFANEAAIRFYSHCLEHLEVSEESESLRRKLTRTLIARGRVLRLVGRGEEAARDFTEAHQTAEALGDPRWIGEALVAEAELARFGGDPEKASQLFERALQRFTVLGKCEGINQAKRGLAAVHWNRGEYAAARDLLVDILSGEYGRCGLWDYADNWNTLGLVQWNLGEYAEAAESLEKALEYREELHDRKGLIASLTNLGIVYERLGRFRRSGECYLQALEYSKQIGFLQGEVASRINLGQLYVIQGIYPSAQDHYMKALDMARRSGDTHAEAMVLGNIGQAWCAQSRLDEAEQWLHQAFAYSQAKQDHDSLMNAERGLAEVEIARGAFDAARRRLESMLATADARAHGDIVVPCRRLLARARRGLGDLDTARREAQAALDGARAAHHRAEELWALYELALIEKSSGQNATQSMVGVRELADELKMPVPGGAG